MASVATPTKKEADTIRLEEFTGTLEGKVAVIWSAMPSAWLPTEFMLAQYITRILVTGRGSPTSLELSADSGWTQVWRSPGGKEWSCLLGILQHMPGPVLLVIGPDLGLTPKIVASLREVAVTTLVLRQVGGSVLPSPVEFDHIFFPVLDARSSAALGPILQEWTTKAVPKALDIRGLTPQLTAQGYGLTVALGIWYWYKPADSAALTSLTVPQIARQIQMLGVMLEKSAP